MVGSVAEQSAATDPSFCGPCEKCKCVSNWLKKMIANCLIKRVEVYRDYKLHIDFNIDLEPFSLGLDIVPIAA